MQWPWSIQRVTPSFFLSIFSDLSILSLKDLRDGVEFTTILHSNLNQQIKKKKKKLNKNYLLYNIFLVMTYIPIYKFCSFIRTKKCVSFFFCVQPGVCVFRLELFGMLRGDDVSIHHWWDYNDKTQKKKYSRDKFCLFPHFIVSLFLSTFNAKSLDPMNYEEICVGSDLSLYSFQRRWRPSTISNRRVCSNLFPMVRISLFSFFSVPFSRD